MYEYIFINQKQDCVFILNKSIFNELNTNFDELRQLIFGYLFRRLIVQDNQDD